MLGRVGIPILVYSKVFTYSIYIFILHVKNIFY
jgi:hypothetical protein